MECADNIRWHLEVQPAGPLVANEWRGLILRDPLAAPIHHGLAAPIRVVPGELNFKFGIDHSVVMM